MTPAPKTGWKEPCDCHAKTARFMCPMVPQRPHCPRHCQFCEIERIVTARRTPPAQGREGT